VSRKQPSNVSVKHSSKHGQAITVLVADESRMSCELMASAFKQSPYAIKVVALAIDSSEVSRAAEDSHPDIAVIRAALKDGPTMGLNAARNLRLSGSKTKVIMLIDSNVGGSVIEAFRAGARGVFCSEDPFDNLCKCIWVVQQGQVWVKSDYLLFVLDYLVQTSPTAAPMLRGSNVLTKREESVVQLVAEGMTNRAVSHRLNLSENTVRNYLFRIFNKLGTSNRLELALYENNRKQMRGMVEHAQPEGALTVNGAASLSRSA
jgi:two-component system nitrate/nitrite response regulator NarL